MKRLLVLCCVFLLSGCAIMQDPIESPYVSLNNLQVRDMTLLEQRYTVTLRVQNPNPVPIPITGISFLLDLNDTELGRGVSAEVVTVPAYGEALVEINLVSNLMRLFDQVRNADGKGGQNLRYRISGGLSLANRLGKIPFEYRGEFGSRH